MPISLLKNLKNIDIHEKILMFIYRNIFNCYSFILKDVQNDSHYVQGSCLLFCSVVGRTRAVKTKIFYILTSFFGKYVINGPEFQHT